MTAQTIFPVRALWNMPFNYEDTVDAACIRINHWNRKPDSFLIERYKKSKSIEFYFPEYKSCTDFG